MNDLSLQTALQFLGSWLDYRAKQVDIPGFSVAISYRGELVFSTAYGLADIGRHEPLTTEHLFGVASQSKMFTATAVLQLAEQGRLTLSDYAVTYLPWLATHRDPRYSRIMIRHLLSHSAGMVRDGTQTDFWQLAQPFPDADGLRSMVLASDLLFDPGKTLKYSNLGYALLGQIIAAASGQSFEAYVRQHIIKRLQLEHTFSDYSPKFAANLATAYGSPDGHRRAELGPRVPSRAMAPAVGIHATAEDMCRFMHAQTAADERLLRNPHKREAHRTQASQDDGYDAGTEFGYGFEIHHIGDHRLIGHDGHLAGFSTASLLDVDYQLAISIMANCRDAPSTQITYGIFEILEWFTEHAAEPTPAALGRFSSRFENATTNIEVIAVNDKIIAFDPDDWQPLTDAEELTRIDKNTLQVTTPGSAFNGGEQMQYRFADDVVQAIRYAGFSLMPEAASEEPVNLLTFADLEHISLRVGRIADVKRVGGDMLRTTIDFGPGLGMEQSLMHNLPTATHYEALKGQIILGGVFPFWHKGYKTEEIVTLGLADGHHALAHSPLAGILFTLEADPSKPRIYSSRNIIQQAAHFPREPQRELFIMQGLPEYYPPEEIDAAEALSLTAWLQGKRNKSLALMREQYEHAQNWRQLSHYNTRIIVIGNTLTAYQRWQIEQNRRVAIPLGDTSYLLHGKYLHKLDLPDDFRIWDKNRVTLNGYAHSHWKYTAVYDSLIGTDVTKFLRMRRNILKLAQTKGQKLQ